MATDPDRHCAADQWRAEQIVVGEGMNECFSRQARGAGVFFNFGHGPGFSLSTRPGCFASHLQRLSCAWNCDLDPAHPRARLLRSRRSAAARPDA